MKRPLERAIKLARLLECPYKITPNGTAMYKDGDTTEKLVECLLTKGIQIYFSIYNYLVINTRIVFLHIKCYGIIILSCQIWSP